MTVAELIEELFGDKYSLSKEDFANGLFDKVGDCMITDYTVSGLQGIFDRFQRYTFDSIKTISFNNTSI